jgi:hypothetical protein
VKLAALHNSWHWRKWQRETVPANLTQLHNDPSDLAGFLK